LNKFVSPELFGSHDEWLDPVMLGETGVDPIHGWLVAAAPIGFGDVVSPCRIFCSGLGV